MNFLVFLLFVSLTSQSLADSSTNKYTNEIEKCSVGSLSESSSCLDNLYSKRNQKLNALYQLLLSKLEDPAPLKKAQRTWLKLRVQSCEYETSGIEKIGGLYYYMQSKCLLIATEKRIDEINEYLACKDLFCPSLILRN